MTDSSTGRFVWYELLTTDPKAAVSFYTHVVGWTAQPYKDSGEYTMFAGSQGPLGGVMTLPEKARSMGAPPHWMAHVTVADVDATVAKVREHGGRVYTDPQDIPEIGRFAVIADPQGASLSVFKPLQPMSPQDPTKSGTFCWNELVTTDKDAALGFYGALFGWHKVAEHDLGPMGTYLLYGHGDTTYGGMFDKPKDLPRPPSWLYYVEVADFDAAFARATARDARVLNGPMKVPTGQRIVQLADPQGAVFALHGV